MLLLSIPLCTVNFVLGSVISNIDVEYSSTGKPILGNDCKYLNWKFCKLRKYTWTNFLKPFSQQK